MNDIFVEFVDMFKNTCRINNERKFGIKDVIFNGPATIVFWDYGTKSVVMCAEDDKYDRNVAILYCLGKKVYGNNSRLHRQIDKFVLREDPIEE